MDWLLTILGFGRAKTVDAIVKVFTKIEHELEEAINRHDAEAAYHRSQAERHSIEFSRAVGIQNRIRQITKATD
jgi:hypothetical protein